MKSKKSIFVVALAALMLIAFTACEQQPNVWNPNGKTPTMATITQTGSFVYGQLFDASKFSVEVTYEDGSVSTISGSGIVTLDSETSWVKDGDTVSVALGTNGSVTGKASIYVSKIDSVTVEGPTEIQLAEDETTTEVTKDDFTVSIGYRDQSGAAQTLVLNPAEYTLAIKSGASDVKFGDLIAGSYTIEASVTMATGTVVGDAKDSETLVVKTYKAETKWNGTDIIVEVVEETAQNPWKIGRKAVSTDMVRVYQSVDGEKGEVLSGYTVAAGTGLNNDKTRFNNTASGDTITDTIVVTYVSYDPITGAKRTATKTTSAITLRADYATSVSFAWKGKGGTANSPYAVGDTYINTSVASEFTCTVDTWKSGYAPTTKEIIALTQANVKSNPATAANTTNTQQPVQLTLTLTQTPEYRDSTVSNTVTVQVAPAATQQPGA